MYPEIKRKEKRMSRKIVTVTESPAKVAGFPSIKEELASMCINSEERIQEWLVTWVRDNTLKAGSMGLYGTLHAGSCASRGIIPGSLLTGIVVIKWGTDKDGLPIKNVTYFIHTIGGNLDVFYDLESEEKESIG